MIPSDEEKLIELVRGYEFLYNVKHPKYTDNYRKERAWKTISLKLNVPAPACKIKWQSLRDSYRRCLKKRKGKEVNDIKKWKYEAEMAFVAPLIMERKPVQQESNESMDPIDEDVYFEPVAEDETEDTTQCSPAPPHPVLYQQEHDEIDRFFLSMSETVKKFSPFMQALAKQRIFGVVSEMELEQLAPMGVAALHTFKQSPQSSSQC